MDDTFEFLTKIYSELTEFRKEANDRFNKVGTDMQAFKNDVLEMEQDHGKKLQALFDDRIQQDRKLEEHSNKLETIDSKLDYLALSINSQDNRLEVVEGSQKRKAK